MSQKIESQKTENFKAKKVEYSCTRNKTGVFEEKEKINKKTIDFSACEGHLEIHQQDEGVAGSIFSQELFANPKEITDFIKNQLPDSIPFDNFGRSEITLTIDRNVGWKGISSIKELQEGDILFERRHEPRFPGGLEEEYQGLKGSWYPESKYNPETKRMEIVKNEDGSVANPKFKFQPNANIAEVSRMPETNLVTCVLVKTSDDSAEMVTAFPGENAPEFPSNLKETLSADSLETGYWKENAFLRLNKELADKESAIKMTEEVSDREEVEK